MFWSALIARLPRLATGDISTWADDYRLSRQSWALLLLGRAGTLAVAGAFLIESHGIHGLVWPLAAAVAHAGYRLQSFRCPRCGRNAFHRKPVVSTPFGMRCVNCMPSKE